MGPLIYERNAVCGLLDCVGGRKIPEREPPAVLLLMPEEIERWAKLQAALHWQSGTLRR